MAGGISSAILFTAGVGAFGLNRLATLLPYHDRTAPPITGLFGYLKRGVYPHTWNVAWANKVQGTPPL